MRKIFVLEKKISDSADCNFFFFHDTLVIIPREAHSFNLC